MLPLTDWLPLRRRDPSAVPAPISVAPSKEFEGNDGPWSTFPVRIGTPPQTVNLLISTSTSLTWPVLPQGCIATDGNNCSTARGGLYNPDTSSSWAQDNSTNNGLAPLIFPFGTTEFKNATGLYGTDTVGLGPSSGGSNAAPSLNTQDIAGFATKDYYLGLFGINPQPEVLPDTQPSLSSYLYNLNITGGIPSLSWGYTAGNTYRSGGPTYGSLTLGGYDSARFVPNDIDFALNATTNRGPTVEIGQIILSTTDIVDEIANASLKVTAIIDSSVPYLKLPLNLCQEFEQTFGLEWNDAVQAYLVNDTLHHTLNNANTSVILNIGNSSTVPGQGVNITMPYGAFDLTASAPLIKNTTRYFPLMRAENKSDVILGRTFLQEAYLIANYEHNNFSVSQCAWTNQNSPNIVAIPSFESTISSSSTSSTSVSISGGAIAGIVIGVLAILGILGGLLAFFLIRRHKQRHIPMSLPNNGPAEMAAGEKDPHGPPPPFSENGNGMHKKGDNEPVELYTKNEAGMPSSPELDTPHYKNASGATTELPGSEGPPSGQTSPGSEFPRFELDAQGPRGSRRISQILAQNAARASGPVEAPGGPVRNWSADTRSELSGHSAGGSARSSALPSPSPGAAPTSDPISAALIGGGGLSPDSTRNSATGPTHPPLAASNPRASRASRSNSADVLSPLSDPSPGLEERRDAREMMMEEPPQTPAVVLAQGLKEVHVPEPVPEGSSGPEHVHGAATAPGGVAGQSGVGGGAAGAAEGEDPRGEGEGVRERHRQTGARVEDLLRDAVTKGQRGN